jgi:Asp-tRNA(Asn)/Glu-tRNA(Gln) amidotransferase A subunit family amidase
VLEAYVARAAQAQQVTNCLTEGTYDVYPAYQKKIGRNDKCWALVWCTRRIVFFEEAKQEAHKLDEEFAATGRLKGPLHGVPISVKDQCTFSPFPPFILFSIHEG